VDTSDSGRKPASSPVNRPSPVARDDEDRLRIALENSRSGIFDWDLLTDTIYRSPSFVRYLGYSSRTIGEDRESWVSLIHPEDRAQVQRIVDQFLERSARGDFEVQYRIRSGRGNWRWILDRGRVTEWQGSTPRRLIGTNTDISYRQAMEDTLRVREAQLRAFVEHSPAAIAIANIDGQYSMINRSFASTFGLEQADLLGKTSDQFMPPDVSSRDQAFDKATVSTLEPSSYEYWMEGDEGRVYRVVNKFAIKDDAGKCVGIGSVQTDVTDFRTNEFKLRESQSKFQDYTELAADWYWETDSQMRFDNLSRTFAKHTGNDIESMLGKTLTEMTTDRSRNPAKWARYYEDILGRRDFRDFECEMRNTDGENIIIKLSGKPVFKQGGVFIGYRGTGRNVTHEASLARQVEFEASHDPLTGLLNRREFERKMNEFLIDQRLARTSNVLCFLDLDRFKIVNDVGGHALGDRLMREFSALLTDQIRDTDILARIGGDEFGLLLRDCPIQDAIWRCEKIIQATADFEFRDSGRRHEIGVSIGAVVATPGTDDCAELLSLADNACYSAKLKGRNRVEFQHSDDTEAFRLRAESRRVFDLPRAIREDRFELMAHPIVPLREDSDRDNHGFFEVLTRMRTSDGGLLPPDTFIHVAERHGKAHDIDRWVIRNALRTLAESQPTFCDSEPLLSINLSGQTVSDSHLYDHISRYLEEFEIPGSAICFEITETAAIANLDDARVMVNRVRDLGCHFALDDFGAGLSSFGYLKGLEVDYLKIDGAFVRGLSENVNRAVILAIQELAQTLYIRTIAEYVEEPNTIDFLRNSGIDYGQGYVWGHPEPLVDVLGKPLLEEDESTPNVRLVHP